MNTPPGLIGMALLFWGWQAGLIWLGVLAALVLEGARFSRARWTFSQSDLDQLWNFSVILFLGVVVFGFVSSEGASALTDLAKENSSANRLEAFHRGARTLVLVLAWMPVAFLPILAAQAYGSQALMDWSTFSWWLRTQRVTGPNPTPNSRGSLLLDWGPGINVAWPFFALCLFSASAGNRRTLDFPIGLFLLLTWALWSRRPAAHTATAWAACILAAGAAGGGVYLGMRGLQELDQKLQAALGARWAGNKGFDPRQSRTAIGTVGRMKLSGSIVFRVESEEKPPELLREASYSFFRNTQWSAPKQNFAPVTPDADFGSWRLTPVKTFRRFVTISRPTSAGRALLAVPHGTGQLDELPVGQLETNSMGVLQISEAPGLIRYRARYDASAAVESPPEPVDLDVPEAEREALILVAKEAGLEALPPSEAVAKLGLFFNTRFRYSLWQGEEASIQPGSSPLAQFLTSGRAGHCEYFATATVLMLRQLGIPARYVSGYSVQEKRGSTWLVRGRHAHAWAQVWWDARWHEVDHTPASWVDIEQGRASFFEKVRDLFSDGWFAFLKVRHGNGEWKAYAPALILLILAYAAWRLFSRKEWKRSESLTAEPSSHKAPGSDSEFYRVEARLLEAGHPRRPSETLEAWIARIFEHQPGAFQSVRPLLQWHYRLRFDPDGLTAAERQALREQTALWCDGRVPAWSERKSALADGAGRDHRKDAACSELDQRPKV